MKPLTLQQIRQAVGGKNLTSIPADVAAIEAICTDTRNMEPGSLFVALRGDRHNAHRFLPEAAAKGAIAALVEERPHHTLPNVHLIQVSDTRAALGKLARFVRQQLSAKVIAVAGSNGKTSTKLLIDAALRGKLRGSISPKSFNNDIGVPLTIFPADPSANYLVLEMGTNHHGEIKILSDMAMPDIAVITNCGAEHLEGLDDLIGVRRENASITSGLRHRGLLVVNGDDEELLALVADYPGRIVTFGFNASNDLFATDIKCDEKGTSFRLNNRRRRVFVPMLGRHSACNALAAIAVARRLRLSEELAISSLAEAQGPEMRLQLQKAGNVTVLNDAYNANPNSMRAAIETVSALRTSGRRIAILGDMRELGRSSDRYHKEIGEFAATAGALNALICVGTQARLIADAAQAAGLAARAITRFDDAISAAAAVPKRLKSGDLVLIKASRSIRLEEVAKAIISSRAEPARKIAS